MDGIINAWMVRNINEVEIFVHHERGRNVGPRLFIHEQLLKQHQQELQHEMEQQRMLQAAGLAGGMRHMAASFGTALIAVGQSLERLEQREHFKPLSSRPDGQTSLSGSLHL